MAKSSQVQFPFLFTCSPVANKLVSEGFPLSTLNCYRTSSTKVRYEIKIEILEYEILESQSWQNSVGYAYEYVNIHLCIVYSKTVNRYSYSGHTCVMYVAARQTRRLAGWLAGWHKKSTTMCWAQLSIVQPERRWGDSGRSCQSFPVASPPPDPS